MDNSYQEERMYKDPVRKKISGVCAGIANYYGVNSLIIRLIALFLLIKWPVLALFGYGVAHWLMPNRYE